MIQSKVNVLRVHKENREGRKLPYRVIAQETGLSPGVLVRLMNSDFERVDRATLDTLCRYFGVGVGAVLEYTAEEGEKAAA
jgi:DNA-binding Xre family transcriptional regulator